MPTVHLGSSAMPGRRTTQWLNPLTGILAQSVAVLAVVVNSAHPALRLVGGGMEVS